MSAPDNTQNILLPPASKQTDGPANEAVSPLHLPATSGHEAEISFPEEADATDVLEQMLAVQQYRTRTISDEAREEMRIARQQAAPPTEALREKWNAYRTFVEQNPDSGW